MYQRLQPIEAPFPAEVEALLAAYPRRDGYLLKLFRVFAGSPRFLRKGVANLLDRDSPLSMRQREIVILRVCANNHCEYEWGVHVSAFAEHVELTHEQVRATRLEGPEAPCWSPTERLLIEVVDQLCRDARIDDASAPRFAAAWTVEQQLEILALCGNYHTISFVANSADLPPEDFAARFPTA